MKKDISIIRDSITKVVTLLTRRSIKVTQRGSKAFVQYNARSGAIELVNIPYLPDDATDEFVAAVQGFLDHEVGHVLFTDPKIMPALSKESSKVKNLANAIEDVYIERKMVDAFSGSVGNLNSVRRFYLDKIAKPKIDAAVKSGDLNAAAGYAGLIQFRAWGGQKMAADFLKDHPECAALAKPMADKLGPELIEKIKKANSSWECLELARAMKKKLEEKPPVEEPDSGPEKSEAPKGAGDKSESKPAPDEKPTDPTEPEDGDDDKPPAEDEGTTHTETDDSGKERDERSETEEEVDPEAGESGGSDTEDRKPGDEPEPKSDEPEPKGDKDDAPPPSEKEEGADSFGGEGASESEDGDLEGEEGEADAEHGSSDDTADDGDDTTASKDGEIKGTDEDGSEDEAESDLSDLFKDERDFDKDMSEALTKAAVGEIKDSDYKIFSTDWDRVCPAPKASSDAVIESMVDKTQHMVAGIQKTLERALAAKSRKTWNPGQSRGRISPGSLFKTAVGDDRVFRQRYETRAKNTAVSLLVDCSGSMRWADKIGTAALAAFALSSTLERLKINHEVIGFTTEDSRAMSAAMKSEGLGVRYARTEALYMPVFKPFKERLGVDAKSRIAHLTEPRSASWLNENVDGECLQIAARRLKVQIAERHVLIVLSDGAPACPGDWNAIDSHLSTVAKKLSRDDKVEVIGIGIQDDSVKRYYDKFVILKNLADLPTTVVAELSKVLLAP